ncbi:MAG: Proline--tRNA ligase [Lachnoclostridium sp.]|jgi:prolyl-tRNA editing enzyme YbaK/EbsC (Cys-tRNA(Pro) deacylase)
MSFEKVKNYFEKAGLGQRVIALEKSSATVEEAAKAIGCQAKEIAKTMAFFVDDKPILIVTAGDAKIDNKKYKNTFNQKAKMIPGEQVETYVGHAPGGVCPFAVPIDVTVYLDVSLKRFETVYPAGGNGQSAVKLSLEELVKYSNASGWVDVCKDWPEND